LHVSKLIQPVLSYKNGQLEYCYMPVSRPRNGKIFRAKKG
jgi:hypothetical protein